MPKSSPTASSDDSKPYTRPEPTTPTKSRVKGEYSTLSASTTTPSPRKGGKGAPWTGWELNAIFDVAITKGPSIRNFDGVVEGRTGKQAYDVWK